jgi:endonuclease/exonuclease/phosphatase (EEP) superfamily protein YafD
VDSSLFKKGFHGERLRRCGWSRVYGVGLKSLAFNPQHLPKISFLTLQYIFAKNLRADSKDF